MRAEDAVRIILGRGGEERDEPGGLHIASLALWSVHALRRGRNPSITSWKSPTILLSNSPWSTSVKPPLHQGPLLLCNCILTSCGDIRVLQFNLGGLAWIIQYSGNSYSFSHLFKHSSRNIQPCRVLFKHWHTVYHNTVNISYKYCIDTTIVTHNRVRSGVGKSFCLNHKCECTTISGGHLPWVEATCLASFSCFPAPTHQIQMNGSLSGFSRAWWRADHLNQVWWRREISSTCRAGVP